MTLPSLLALPPDARRDIVQRSARRELLKRSFPDFLAQCHILSDDAQHPEDILFVPRDYQLERALAWQEHKSEVIVKPRQMGYSWLLAAYKVWRAVFYGWHIAYYSKGDNESTAQIEMRVLYIIEHLPDWLRPKYTKRREELKFPQSGGMIHAFPATQTAGASYTFQLVIADEAALHEYGAENYEIYRPTLSAGGQYIAASSANPRLGPFGFFFELWTGATTGRNGYDPVFVPWYRHPDRDQKWYDENRAAFPGDKAAFDAQYPSTPDEAFKNKSGLVYTEFSREQNVKECEWSWEDADIRVVGIDPGGSDPTAVIPLGFKQTPKGPHFHVFGEYFKRGPVSVMDIGDYLQRINSIAPIHRIVVDPSSTLTVPTLKGMGWPAKTADNDKLSRIGQVSHLFRNGTLTIDPSCTEMIYEIQTYWWVERRNMVAGSKSPVLTRTAASHHADEPDAMGYAVLEAIRLTNHALNDRQVQMIWR